MKRQAKIANKFVIGGPILDQELYCLRPEDDLLYKRLKTVNRTFIAECRRLGKTSMVRHCILSSKDLMGIYCDLKGVNNFDSLIYALLNTKEMTMKIPGKIRDKIIALRDEQSRMAAFLDEMKVEDKKKFVSKIIKTFSEFKYLNKKVILILDEFQEIGESKNSEIEDFLRSVIQQLSDLNVVYLGSDRRKLAEMFQDNSSRPFSGQAARFSMGPIPQDVFYKHFCRILSDTKLNKDAFGYIYDLCVGVTEDVQRLMLAIYEQSIIDGTDQVSLSFVKEVIKKKVAENSNEFSDKYYDLTLDQQKVISFIANNPVIPQENKLDYIKLKSERSIREAIDRLLSLRLIEDYRTETQYRIYSVLFKAWLQAR